QRSGRKNEAIDLRPQPDGAETEAPLFALRDGRRRGEVVDLQRLDGGGLQSVDPARSDRRLEPGRLIDIDAVEPQRLRAAIADAYQRQGLVFEHETLRRRKGEAELGMHEARAAHQTLGRI